MGMTFKQFMVEGEADMVLALKEPIAKALKMSRYKVDVHKMSTQKVDGWTQFVLRLSIPSEQESDFFASMVEKLLKRELAKVRPTAQVEVANVSPWKGSSGLNFDTLFVYFRVPNEAI